MSKYLSSLLLPEIYPLVEELLRHGKIGISGSEIRVQDIQTGAHTLCSAASADRMKLIIPYAGNSLNWDMLFFGNSADFPPDFYFDDKTFFPDISSVKSLQDWSKSDNKSLLRLVHELIAFYRDHQLNLVTENSILLFEYTSLIELEGFSKKDVEILLDKNGQFRFLIKLPCDFSSLPNLVTTDNPSEDSAILLVAFQSSPGYQKVSAQLSLSPKIEQLMIGLTQSLPKYPPEGTLTEYVELVCKYIQSKIERTVNNFQKKKDFVDAFLKRYGNFVLEHDSDHFEKLSFLLEWKNFSFILNIEVTKSFPEDKPKLSFQSIYHLANEQPFTATTQEYPYSPRWSAQELVARMRTFILEYLPTFQKTSIRNIK